MKYYEDYVDLTAYFNNKVIPDGSNVTWSYDKNYVYLDYTSGPSVRVYALANTPSGGTTITAKYSGYTATYTIYVNISSQISVSATVSSSYYLGEGDDKGTDSVWDKIESYIYKNISKNYDLAYITFDNVTSTYGDLDASTKSSYEYDEDDFDAILFTPEKKGDAVFNFRAYVWTSASVSKYTPLTGTLTIKVTDTIDGGDIFFQGAKGEDITLDMDEFEDFWTDYQSKGSLSYIEIDSISGGKLYTSDGKSVSTGTDLYVSPTTRQRDLDGLYFTPSSKSTSSGRITFTAHGSRSGSGSSLSRKGTVTLSFLSSAASTIKYEAKNGTVTLDPDDFIAAYQEATGNKTKSPNLTIQFQEVPSYGTLTYTDSSKKNAKDVKLTSSNIKSYKFNVKTSSSTSNKIGDVTYTVSGSRTDTIKYTGYIGNTATFTGEVTFNAVTAPTDVRVSFTCFQTTGVALTPSSFTSANAAMANANYVILGTPRMGRLTNANGTSASNTAVQIVTLGGVTYVPTTAATGTAVTDSFTFTAYNVSGTVVASGTVGVTVSLPATTTPTPGAITNISQLTDVPANAYYRSQLTNLINRGVINGTGNGKYSPDREVEYSEALKFIMNAAGYFETNATGVGVNWAQNYKNTAVQRGWISSSVDLTKPIGRVAMAELAARILGIPQGTGTSPFVDTDSPWATALFNATYTQSNGTTGRIVQGDLWDNGTRHFNPNKALCRHEMVCLVYNMYQYRGQ